jgi:hypothetical protein
MAPPKTPQTAEILGLEALGWLAGEPDGLERFLRASGADEADLRRFAGERHQLAAILEFLLANEDLLLRFCESGSKRPMDVHAAHRLLEG